MNVDDEIIELLSFQFQKLSKKSESQQWILSCFHHFYNEKKLQADYRYIEQSIHIQDRVSKTVLSYYMTSYLANTVFRLKRCKTWVLFNTKTVLGSATLMHALLGTWMYDPLAAIHYCVGPVQIKSVDEVSQISRLVRQVEQFSRYYFPHGTNGEIKLAIQLSTTATQTLGDLIPMGLFSYLGCADSKVFYYTFGNIGGMTEGVLWLS